MSAATARRVLYCNPEPELRRRREPVGMRIVPARISVESVGVPCNPTRRSAPRSFSLRNVLGHNLLRVCMPLLFVGSVGWCALLYSQLRSSVLTAPALSASDVATTEALSSRGQSDAADPSSFADGESAAGIVARDWSLFQSMPAAELGRRSTKEATNRPQVRLASLESTAPIAAFNPSPDTESRLPANIGAKTSLVHFATAPFPYHGEIPGSDRPFLNARNHRGHVNFRGRVFLESPTYSDNRVLLHIPPGFDPRRPAVMVVFFHGHGAELARDVRDRQRVPAQITAAGVNAVLVAPQFAVDAADSSAGKFWEPDGFKRFLDEAAQKLARLYGNPRSVRTFAKMPIVIVAYSGGFGPTLAVLERGGVRSRIRGVVLLDALYAGIDKFADWIANNRSAFFVSSYTPHTAYHNAALKRLLDERSVPYGSELRRHHLQGMVAFLPAGDVPHRDFVTHAWADNPIKNILARMDDINPKIETAGGTASIFANAFPAAGN